MHPLPSDLLSTLRLCTELFQPEHCVLYVEENAHGVMKEELTGIPAQFPQNFREMQGFSGHVYGLMLSLGLPEPYLAYPNFDDLIARQNTLCLEECAQFLLFYMRSNLKFGQDFYYSTWQKGTVLTVVNRMLSLLDKEN